MRSGFWILVTVHFMDQRYKPTDKERIIWTWIKLLFSFKTFCCFCDTDRYSDQGCHWPISPMCHHSARLPVTHSLQSLIRKVYCKIFCYIERIFYLIKEKLFILLNFCSLQKKMKSVHSVSMYILTTLYKHHKSVFNSRTIFL